MKKSLMIFTIVGGIIGFLVFLDYLGLRPLTHPTRGSMGLTISVIMVGAIFGLLFGLLSYKILGKSESLRAKTKGIIGVVCGILGLIIVPIILGPLAIYFGMGAKRENSRTLGITSITLGLISIILIFFVPLSISLTLETLEDKWDTEMPIVRWNSNSMTIKSNMEDFWIEQGKIYLNYSLGKEQINNFFEFGTIGKNDILLTKGGHTNEIVIGDVILFKGENIIIAHRVIGLRGEGQNRYFTTKGDANLGILPTEKNISEEQIYGKVFRVIHLP
jgi:hypothetical protein